jgi:hypothetical protein
MLTFLVVKAIKIAQSWSKALYANEMAIQIRALSLTQVKMYTLSLI